MIKIPATNKPVVFLVDVELKILPCSYMYEEEVLGTCVFGFCVAFDSNEAISKVKSELIREGCELKRVINVRPYAGKKWDNKKNQEEMDGYAIEALNKSEVIFSPFLSYTEE